MTDFQGRHYPGEWHGVGVYLPWAHSHSCPTEECLGTSWGCLDRFCDLEAEMECPDCLGTILGAPGTIFPQG